MVPLAVAAGLGPMGFVVESALEALAAAVVRLEAAAAAGNSVVAAGSLGWVLLV